MEYLPRTETDEGLIEAAKRVIRENCHPDRRHLGAAVRAKSGRTYAGVHLESNAIDVCAEAVALRMAASNGEREFENIVAVAMEERTEPGVVPPCAICSLHPGRMTEPH